ncbi:glycosyltransferase [Ravibacter arvi]|uniref:glycosyltransferase n=1 Tax=Ravibacter arvi TaxID=2051041 RepID=UPI0031E903BE
MEVKKVYIIRNCYEPNIASINRSLAFSKGYGELGVDTKVVFVFPNYKKDRVEQSFLNVEFLYLWEKYCPSNKYLRNVFLRFALLLFVLRLKKDDTVLLYGTINPWYLFCLKRNIRIYNEITEHPRIHTERNGLVGKIQYWLFGKFCRRIDGVMPITPSLSEFFVDEFGIAREKVQTINMIVDSTRFDSVRGDKRKSTIAYCGTISEKKDGISDLLKAFQIVLTRYKDATLTLIGDFESSVTRENVYALLKTLKIENNVLITGMISADEMPVFLSEAKVLALSRPQNMQAKYGFPTKLGEYLMTANPVVITDVGDFRLYLKDREDIVYAAPDNFTDFADKLLWVLDNYDQAKIIGMKGRQVALDSFNYRIEAEKVLDFIFK